jgi:hypothetical protein
LGLREACRTSAVVREREAQVTIAPRLCRAAVDVGQQLLAVGYARASRRLPGGTRRAFDGRTFSRPGEGKRRRSVHAPTIRNMAATCNAGICVSVCNCVVIYACQWRKTEYVNPLVIGQRPPRPKLDCFPARQRERSEGAGRKTFYDLVHACARVFPPFYARKNERDV